MRHLLVARLFRQLLGDEAAECAEDSFPLTDWEHHPERVRIGDATRLAAARGGQRPFDSGA